jgi:hypothetical protein
VTGNGKTSLKASYGIFGDTKGADFSQTYNPNSLITTRYRWTGPCVVTQATNVSFNLPNTSCDFQPGSVDFTTGSKDYISASGGLNTLPNPDLKQNKNYEASVRLDRQLMANVGVGFATSITDTQLVQHRDRERGTAVRVWTVPVVLADTFNGQPTTVYTYPVRMRARRSTTTKCERPSDRPDYYTASR